MEDITVEGKLYRQEVATCHTARETLTILYQTFPGRVICHFSTKIGRYDLAI